MKRRIAWLFVVVLVFSGCAQSRQEQPDPLQGITLSGLMYTPDGLSIAVINGQTVKEGQAFQGFTVKGITDTHVVLTRGGKDFRLEPAGTGGALPPDVSTAASLGASRMSVVTSQTTVKEEDDFRTRQKMEYLTLARSHERQAYSLRDNQQALYHIQQAIDNYKNAMSLEEDRLERTDIELKIERLQDQIRVVNNRMNRPATDPLQHY